jgi:nitrogen-specific signal transduction histidine kinase/CheY-like chemotaxis protein
MSQSLVKEGDASLGRLLVLRDITRQKETEEELFKMRSMESIGQLAGGIAHDFNNYLCGIVSSFTLARMDIPAGSETGQVLVEGERAALSAQGLTRQLLTFAKGGTIRKEPFDPLKVIRDMSEFAVRGSAAKLETDLPDRSPSLIGDASQFGQVVQNLVVNACQAMPDGGTVRLSGEICHLRPNEIPGLAEGDYFRLVVEDTGVGIAEPVQPRVFEPYFTTKEGGNGLGLAVVYSIVKRHNGSISLTSREGKGSTFTAWFAAGAAPTAEYRPSDGKKSTAGGRVLVMDDSDVVRRLLTRLVSKLGYDVDSAASGDEALAIYDRALEEGLDYVAVISDLTVVGGMGGREFARNLQARDADLPIIISSGYSEELELARYSDYGFAGVLHKPYSYAELRSALANCARAPSA